MADSKKIASSQKILEKMLLETMSNRPVFFNEIHSQVYRFAKKYKLDANQVAKLLQKMIEEKTKEVFSKDFSKKPKNRHYHGSGH